MGNLGRYSRIDKATLIDKHNSDNRFINCYILTGYNTPEEFEVELTGDMAFNTEYRVEDREMVMKVNNLDELSAFMNQNQFATDVDEYLKKINGETVLMTVGGGKDMLVFANLEYNWFENLKSNDNEMIVLKNKDGVCVKEVTAQELESLMTEGYDYTDIERD